MAFSALLVTFVFAGCGGGGGGGCDEPEIEIVEPMDGDTFTGEDEIDVVVEACGHEPETQIVLVLTEPVMSDYGFERVTSTERETLTYRAPLLPGTNRFVAQTPDGTVTSDPVAVTTE